LPRNAFTYPPGETFIKIFEPGHGRSTGDTVRFRNVVDIFTGNVNRASGHTITKIDDDFYSISTELAFAGEPIKGGGEIASAGPVTITP
jgi:hypothetical protein